LQIYKTRVQKIGLVAGPLIFAFVVMSPIEGLSFEAKVVLGAALWMSAWWVTEAIPLYATSLLPLVIFPQSVSEEVEILMKNEDGACVVEPSDRIPRTISNCQYDEGDTIMVTYNANQPIITSHELLRKGQN
jgi:di/tricarboxylate transporter